MSRSRIKNLANTHIADCLRFTETLPGSYRPSFQRYGTKSRHALMAYGERILRTGKTSSFSKVSLIWLLVSAIDCSSECLFAEMKSS